MRLFNKGKRLIQHAESKDSSGRFNRDAEAAPGKVFTVSDALGRKLKQCYANELESLDDAQDKFRDPHTPSAVPAAVAHTAASLVGIPLSPDRESPATSSAAVDAPGNDENLDPPATETEIAEAKQYGLTVAAYRAEMNVMKAPTGGRE